MLEVAREHGPLLFGVRLLLSGLWTIVDIDFFGFAGNFVDNYSFTLSFALQVFVDLTDVFW